MQSTPSGHIRNNFDFLRIVAASAVLVGHQFALLGLAEPNVASSVSIGTLGLYAFFAISGYLVTQSWQLDPHVLRFIARRALRIWPGLAAVTVLTVFAMGPLVSELGIGDYFLSSQTFDYLQTLRLKIQYYLPGVFERNPYPRAVNGSLWTIPLEVHWYVVLLAAGVLRLLKWRWLVLAATIGVAVMHFGLDAAEADSTPNYRDQLGLYFMAGACLQLWREFWQAPRARLRVGAALLCSAIVWLAFGHSGVALWLVLPFAAIAFGAADLPVVARFGRFGDISYGLYIYGFPVQQLVIAYAHLPGGVFMHLLVSMLATSALAWLSWHAIERPALAMKPGRASRNPATTMVAT